MRRRMQQLDQLRPVRDDHRKKVQRKMGEEEMLTMYLLQRRRVHSLPSTEIFYIACMIKCVYVYIGAYAIVLGRPRLIALVETVLPLADCSTHSLLADNVSLISLLLN